MNGNKLFIDTNIILYLLNGDKTLVNLLNNQTIYISFITELELLAYPGITVKDQIKIREFLSSCIIVDIDDRIKKEVVLIKKKHKLKLPDSIIIASAIYYNLPLISADVQFKHVEELDFFLYQP